MQYNMNTHNLIISPSLRGMGKVPVVFLFLFLCACTSSATRSGLRPDKFQSSVNNRQTALYTLTNTNGMEVCITNFGGRIVSLLAPDRDGVMRDVVLGFDNVRDYQTVPTDFGACIGRYANRLDHGRITIDGTTYQLLTNNYGHTLHGGPTGWQYQVYDAEQPDNHTLRLTIHSPDGDNGFPGNVVATCTYTLTGDNTLRIDYTATTDAPTVINMTNHSYFNLTGNGNNDILSHTLWLNATRMTPVDSTFMTIGEIADISAGSPFDFWSAPKPIGQDINAGNTQLRNGHGYDHNFILNPRRCGTVCPEEEAAGTDIYAAYTHAATLYCPATGIALDVLTTEPGIQVYSGNFLDGTVTGKRGEVYGRRHAVCLETQHYPNTPNTPSWPSTTLRPGQEYRSTTLFRFSCR